MTDDVAQERQTEDIEAVQHVEQPGTADEINQEALPPRLTLWQRFRQLLGLLPAEHREQIVERILALDEVIAVYPDAASNYVTRGELYLELQQEELAVIDFQRALEITVNDLESDRWGVVAQTVQDRAQHGLEMAQKRLNRERL